jgi:hypothetical protein
MILQQFKVLEQIIVRQKEKPTGVSRLTFAFVRHQAVNARAIVPTIYVGTIVYVDGAQRTSETLMTYTRRRPRMDHTQRRVSVTAKSVIGTRRNVCKKQRNRDKINLNVKKRLVNDNSMTD